MIPRLDTRKKIKNNKNHYSYNGIPDKRIISKIPFEFTPRVTTPSRKMRRFTLNIAQKRLADAGELSALPVSPI